ncbi:NAD(P)-binding protein [Ascobolus immersus RN42]|uniref:NAD(P)-binding protein n=1 Tax=Ascobolus immersus RN42 TaxID=1160509 RepID=A0A3N4IU45_ASCIM|nr:NAD(P)-binding protein [Ascobolus immersus RN42]
MAALSEQQQAVKDFFSAQHIAVVGASPDESKFGFKVLKWYHAHAIPATPINPKRPTILNTPSLASISELPDPKNTVLSIITNPKITLGTVKQAAELGIKIVWIQPGAYDDEVLRTAKDVGVRVIAGHEGGTRGGEGWCVLVDGEAGLRSAGKSGKL